jgi:hypothetical protein
MTQYNVQFQDGNGSLAGLRNLLINSLFTINQRAYVSATATTAANQYTVDRWCVVTSGQNLTFSATAGVGTATAPAGGLKQIIEGASIIGGTYTLSWTGTATATVNGTAVANGGTVTLTGGVNCPVIFSGGTVSEPQLEPGPVATPFEQRPIGLELSLCQRYFQVIRGTDSPANNVTVGAGASSNASGSGSFAIPFPGGEMRTSPSIYRTTGTVGWGVLGGTPVSGSEFNIGKSGYMQSWTSGVGTGTRQGSYAFLNSNGIIEFDAEL